MSEIIKLKKISFIIPCYNSENMIEVVVDSIRTAIKAKFDYKIILVNDNSKDNVYDKITNICLTDKNVVGISLSKNYGQQAARMAALPYIEGDYVIFMDDDGQHPVNGIEVLVNKLDEGYDIVYAYFREKKESNFKKFGSHINSVMTNIIIGKPKEINASSFFAMKYYVAEQLKRYTSPFPYLFGYLMQITNNITNIELEHKERLSGETGYNFIKLLKLWLNGFTSFSVIPLRIATFIGIITSLFGFLYAVLIVINKVINPEVIAGYTSMMAALLFIGGIIMMLLGMLGEYIGRIFITLNNVPQYTIKDKRNC